MRNALLALHDHPEQAERLRAEPGLVPQLLEEALRFDVEQLGAYMTSHVDGFHGPLQVRQFRGGQSNPTYLLEAASGRYVLRRKPPGKKSSRSRC